MSRQSLSPSPVSYTKRRYPSGTSPQCAVPGVATPASAQTPSGAVWHTLPAHIITPRGAAKERLTTPRLADRIGDRAQRRGGNHGSEWLSKMHGHVFPRAADTRTRLSTTRCRAACVGVEPPLDLVDIEADEASDVVVRDPVLVNKTSYVPDAGVQPGGQLLDVEQWRGYRGYPGSSRGFSSGPGRHRRFGRNQSRHVSGLIGHQQSSTCIPARLKAQSQKNSGNPLGPVPETTGTAISVRATRVRPRLDAIAVSGGRQGGIDAFVGEAFVAS